MLSHILYTPVFYILRRVPWYNNHSTIMPERGGIFDIQTSEGQIPGCNNILAVTVSAHHLQT